MAVNSVRHRFLCNSYLWNTGPCYIMILGGDETSESNQNTQWCTKQTNIAALFRHQVLELSIYLYFPVEGGGRRDYPRELDNFETFGFNSLTMCHKFVLKHRRSLTCGKVVCQIPEGSDCFGCLIPSPPRSGGKH